jgi:hypothetical protein
VKLEEEAKEKKGEGQATVVVVLAPYTPVVMCAGGLGKGVGRYKCEEPAEN